VDIDADGHIDILSGSYHEDGGYEHMTGLFWVLKGKADGTFAKATALNGTDGKALVVRIPESERDDMNAVVRSICTRPTAIDYDGDGDLDIVAGNFEGTFYLFEGLGDGEFEPNGTPLTTADGEQLTVGHHSDPVFVDWDGDGDLDLLSGSGHGVHLFMNVGADGEHVWTEARDLFSYTPAVAYDEVVLGEEHITRPQGNVRVWVEDLNGDGLFDLVMGDSSYVTYPAEGLTEDEVRAKLADWQERLDALVNEYADDMMSDEAGEAFDAMYRERDSIVEQSGVGFVYVAYQRAAEPREASAPTTGD